MYSVKLMKSQASSCVGVKTYTCTGCGETKTEAVAATGHIWDEGTDNGNGKMVYKCTGCHDTYSVYKTYAIGNTGPGGGLVFYDCDADNETGNADGLMSSECGWRYLEAASEDLGPCVFGYLRESDAASNQAVGTSQSLGTGKSNTEALVIAMGDEVYSASSGSDKTSSYAAKICADCTAGGKDDWFLPSRDELNLMYTNLHDAGLGDFAISNEWYESSSESGGTFAWKQNFSTGDKPNLGRGSLNTVRPVRSF